MENTSSQKSIRQFFLRIGSDDDDRPVLRSDRLFRLIDIEFHLVQFPQQIVWELQIGFIDLVDQ